MVQIIQAGPSEGTLRQQALNDSMNTIINGLGAYQQQQEKKALTLRQQALQDQQQKSDSIKTLVSGGYEINPTNMALIQGKDVAAPMISPAQPATEAQPAIPGTADTYKAPVTSMADLQQAEPGRISQIMSTQKEATPAMEAQPAKYGPKPTLTYTAEKQAEIERKNLLGNVDIQAKLTTLEKTRQDILNDKTMSPIKQRAALADIDLKLGQIAKQPYEIQKLQAETLKTQKDSTPGAATKLAKMSGETQGKVGAIASGLKALQGLGDSVQKGVSAKYLDANTPVIGGLISDNSFTQNQRVLDEVIGRLQSGGAIGTEEIKTFRSLGPRPGDNNEQQLKKLADQKSFLLNKLTAFGLKESDLSELGFDIGRKSSVADVHPEASQAMQWAQQNPNDPRAKQIMERVQ